MQMDEELDEIHEAVYKSVPDDPPTRQSKLEPHRVLILKWKRDGRSLRRIQILLAEKFDLKVAYSTLQTFVQSRSKPTKPEPELIESEPVATVAAMDPPKQKRSAEEKAANIKLARYDRSPASEPPATPEERFKFSPERDRLKRTKD